MAFFIFFMIILVLASLIGLGLYFLITRAVVFSKATFALFIAFLCSALEFKFVSNNDFLNYVAWAIICVGAIYLLSILPRIDISMRFLCTFLVSYFITGVAAFIIGTIVTSNNFQLTLLYEIILKIVCLAVSVGCTLLQEKRLISDSSSNFIIRNTDRIFASLMYSISVFFISLSVFNNWKLSGIAILLLFVGSFAATFVADIFLADKILFREPTLESTQ